MVSILVMIVTLISFLAIILLLAAKPKYAGKITSTFIVIAGLGGIFFYGYGFSATLDNQGLAFIRALLAVCGMYVGKMDIGSISAAPLMQHTYMHILFWIVHLLALYATASAAITTVGAQALRKLRLWLARRGTLHLIYGVSDDTLTLGKQLLQQKRGSVVFVDAKPDATNTAAIASAGCVLRTDDSALRADQAFLRSIGAGRKGRRIHVYALESLTADNLHYAHQLLDTLQENGTDPELTSLVIRARENADATSLQVLGDHYGFGSVSVVQTSSLAARTLIQNYPPCNYIDFDETGKATCDFEALIVGFGQVGQNVLRQLVMNGQFEGSHFRVSVFAPDHNATKGYFSRSYAQVLEQYDITFHAADARSDAFYQHLSQRGNQLKYIAICTGKELLDLEIAEDLTEYLRRLELEIPIFLCGRQGVRHFNALAGSGKLLHLYRPEVLSMEEMDRLAMLVNAQYQSDRELSPWQHWLRCDHFSRMSCRAMADFIPAMLRMAGTTQAQIQKDSWTLTDKQLENMSKAEHLRWCAFHFCMGFAPMTAEEYDLREATYRQQIAAGEPPLRVGKNMVGRTHACLIGWEELDALSQRESSFTGKQIDYKAMDTDNVLLIPALLQVRKKTEV